jgi:hypothetical protein
VINHKNMDCSNGLGTILLKFILPSRDVISGVGMTSKWGLRASRRLAFWNEKLQNLVKATEEISSSSSSSSSFPLHPPFFLLLLLLILLLLPFLAFLLFLFFLTPSPSSSRTSKTSKEVCCIRRHSRRIPFSSWFLQNNKRTSPGRLRPLLSLLSSFSHLSPILLLCSSVSISHIVSFLLPLSLHFSCSL